jgi:cell division septum initiation protein DivIVA
MSIGKKILNVLILLCIIGLLGCPSEQESPVEETPPPGTTSQPETTPGANQPADAKTSSEETLQNQYTRLDQNIQNLENKAEEIPGENKEEFNQMVHTIKRQQEVVKERLDALKASGSEGWEQLEDSTKEALNDLQNTYDKMAARFL